MDLEEMPEGFSGARLLGAGAAAQVFRVRDELLGRDVALKLYHDHRAGAGETRESFMAECMTAARLGAHPGVVTVHSAGVTPTGRPWLCMELASGGSLAQALQAGGPWELSQALRVATFVAETLAWAFRLDPPTLHRDIKPGNILLTGSGQPWVADFGISGVVDHTRSSVTVRAFTQLYAAPEVLHSSRFSPASEVWSLTATLFTMITGDPPFPVVVGEGFGAYIDRVRKGLPDDALPDGLPAETAEVLRRGLAADRDKRYHDVTELAVALRAAWTATGVVVDKALPEPPADEIAATTLDRTTGPAGPAGVIRIARRRDGGLPGDEPAAAGAGASGVTSGLVASPPPPRPPGSPTVFPPRPHGGTDPPFAGPGTDGTRRGRRRWLAVAIVAALCLLAAVAVPVALGILPDDDGPTASQATMVPSPTGEPPGSRGASTTASPTPSATASSGSPSLSPSRAPGSIESGGSGPGNNGGSSGRPFGTTATANWSWSSLPGFWNIDQRLKLETLGDHSFWAVDWVWPDGSTFGYLGLQTDGNRFDGSVGDMAILSAWNTVAAQGPSCQQLDQPNLHSCRLPFTVAADRWYRLRLWRTQTDAVGQWWGAWIMDESTGQDTYIGSMAVDPSRNLVGNAVTHTEYFGGATNCGQVGRSVATWTSPSANSNGDAVGTYSVSSSFASGNAPGCGASVVPQTLRGTRGTVITVAG